MEIESTRGQRFAADTLRTLYDPATSPAPWPCSWSVSGRQSATSCSSGRPACMNFRFSRSRLGRRRRHVQVVGPIFKFLSTATENPREKRGPCSIHSGRRLVNHRAGPAFVHGSRFLPGFLQRRNRSDLYDRKRALCLYIRLDLLPVPVAHPPVFLLREPTRACCASSSIDSLESSSSPAGNGGWPFPRTLRILTS